MRVAQWISILFHPIFTIVAMLGFVLFQKNTYVYYTISPLGKWFFLGTAFTLTVLAPVVSVAYLYYSKQISSMYLPERKERIVPLTITAAYTVGLYYLFSSFQLPQIVLAVVAVGVVGVLLSLLITLVWKISGHMMAVGGFGGVVLAWSETVHPIHEWSIALFFLLMGIIGWARLKMEAHTLEQVLVGWFLGMGVSYGVMMYLTQNPFAV